LRSWWTARALGACPPPLALVCVVFGSWAWSGCTTDAGAGAEPPSARCAGCHLQEYRTTTHPPHVRVRPATCAVCHSQTAWHPSQLLHSFPLDGAHAKTACFACHQGTSPTFEGTSKQCLGCHATDRRTADIKVQRHATFSSRCDTCHSTTAWKPTLPEDESQLGPVESGAPPPTATAHPPATVSKPSASAAGPKVLPSTSLKWPAKSAEKGTVPDQISGASRTNKQ
jgi:Cytochrome c7 and related cytochrome c